MICRIYHREHVVGEEIGNVCRIKHALNFSVSIIYCWQTVDHGNHRQAL
jgi:hypothetical protein